MKSNCLKTCVLGLLALTGTFSVACTTNETEEDTVAINPFYHEDTDTIKKHVSENEGLVDSILIVAHWNIGHFSQGKSSDTKITVQGTDSLSGLYLDLIERTSPDIFGVCEYNYAFNVSGVNTAELLFSSFPYSYIGKRYNYNCNSFFSHMPLLNGCQYIYSQGVQTRYYSVADFIMNGNIVKFVETHLDFNQGINGATCRLSQMRDLVNAFKDHPYVVICADYNTRIREEYNVFREAGFSLATDSLPNAGSPSDDSSQIIIDNIIVKGFRVKETKVYPHMSLSDHDLIWGRLVITD